MGTFQDLLFEEQVYIDLLEFTDEDMVIFAEYLLEDSDEQLDEVLSLMARTKKSQQMKRMSAKLQKKREKNALKVTPKAELIKRARKAAVSAVKAKLTKGKVDLSNMEKERIEKKIQGMSAKIDKIAKKKFKEVARADKEKRDALKLKNQQPEGGKNGIV